MSSSVSSGRVRIYKIPFAAKFCKAKILKSLSRLSPVSLWPPASPHSFSSSVFLHLIASHLCPSLRAIMVSHKEFVGAGKQPGLQVWRIENLDLKPVPKALHGSFYTGDAYLLLFTTSAPSYNIHMWLGKTWTHIVHLGTGQHVNNPISATYKSYSCFLNSMLLIEIFLFILLYKKYVVTLLELLKIGNNHNNNQHTWSQTPFYCSVFPKCYRLVCFLLLFCHFKFIA